MTDRIKQLAEQAGFIVSAPTLNPTLEKFAELIILECLHAVEDAGGIDKYHYTTAIKNHFGVNHD